MKNKIRMIGFAAYLIAIVVLVSISLASCSSGSYSTCAAYNNIELTSE